ncbi:MAG TPA: hypothetical protein VKP65_22400 [Rhodothermales bacterium]|nr:hypothetical protein [Rhodothermales bacterium]
MIASAEVRWFYRGSPPDAVSAWFDLLDPHAEPPRTDWYLRPTDAAMNVKWREGQMQPKRRDAPGEAITFAENIHGLIERWRKWSIALQKEGPADFSREPLWQPVTKSRLMRTFQRDGDRRIVPVPAPADDYPDVGCQVELARLETEAEVWWSLCFESFGLEVQLRDLLVETATHVFSNGMPPTLDLSHSSGYAEWLLVY